VDTNFWELPAKHANGAKICEPIILSMSFDLPAGGDLIGEGDEGMSGKWFPTIQQKNLPEIAANFRLFFSGKFVGNSGGPECEKVATICGKFPGNFFLKEFQAPLAWTARTRWTP
jgi:hypothetical protein